MSFHGIYEYFSKLYKKITNTQKSLKFLSQFTKNLSKGVKKSAKKEEIKKAFKKLAKKLHPDVNKTDPNANQRFSEINTAYQILNDDEKRKIYDATGSEEAAQNGQNTAGGSANGSNSYFYSSGGPGAGGFEGIYALFFPNFKENSKIYIKTF